LNRDFQIAAAAAAAGVLVTSLGAALLWPEPRLVQSQPPTPPAVSPPPSLASMPTDLPTFDPTSTDERPTDEQSDAGDDDGGDEEDWWDREPADAPPLADAPPAGQGPLPDASPVECPAPTVTVDSAEELEEALEDADPGDSIALEDGTYVGEFVATASGTESEPIFLCGGAGAVLDGDDIEGGYVFHLDQAKYWRVVGFTVTNGQKGVMADGTVGTTIQGLTVHHIGDEAIHLRNNSTDNVVLGNTISDLGLRRDKYGEGVYIGTAVSNWCEYTDCQPDRSDRNVIRGNAIARNTSEAIDIKEGTTGGVVIGNTFDGSAITGADSWVDVKGNNWLIAQNTGAHSPGDGFQTHQILDGWGDHNVFSGNTARVDGPGFGFSMTPAESNVVTCDNTATGAAEGFSNIDCR
jgi:hypothetical protein